AAGTARAAEAVLRLLAGRRRLARADCAPAGRVGSGDPVARCVYSVPGMRAPVIIIAAILSNGCAPAMMRGTVGGADTEHVEGCTLAEPCAGGSGQADGVISIAVGGAILGTLAFALYRHMTKGSPAASR